MNANVTEQKKKDADRAFDAATTLVIIGAYCRFL
jgi:hypothetical protein